MQRTCRFTPVASRSPEVRLTGPCLSKTACLSKRPVMRSTNIRVSRIFRDRQLTPESKWSTDRRQSSIRRSRRREKPTAPTRPHSNTDSHGPPGGRASNWAALGGQRVRPGYPRLPRAPPRSGAASGPARPAPGGGAAKPGVSRTSGSHGHCLLRIGDAGRIHEGRLGEA